MGKKHRIIFQLENVTPNHVSYQLMKMVNIIGDYGSNFNRGKNSK